MMFYWQNVECAEKLRNKKETSKVIFIFYVLIFLFRNPAEKKRKKNTKKKNLPAKRLITFLFYFNSLDKDLEVVQFMDNDNLFFNSKYAKNVVNAFK